MSTALDNIKATLRLLGVLASGETPQSSEANDALSALNRMLSSWNNSRLTVFGVKIEEFTLVPNQSSYTIGDGGDFDTEVPLKIDSIFLKDGETEYPLELIDNKKWGSLQSKTTTSSIPFMAYVDINHPLKKIYLYPTPSEAKTIVLHNYRKISAISSLVTEFVFPDGYEEAIIYNLAIRLAPEYGKSISGEISTIASQSLSAIKRANIRAIEVGVDDFLLARDGFDWRTGQ